MAVSSTQDTPSDGGQGRLARATAWCKQLAAGKASETTGGARQKYTSVDVGFRSAERQRRIAAMVLAGGIAYRLFFWLLAVSVLFGGVLGFFDPDSVETTLEGQGVGKWIADAAARVAHSASGDEWWLVPVGCWLVLWTGYTCSRTLVLAHATVWRVEPPRSKPLWASMLFSGCALGLVGVLGAARWVREQSEVGGLVFTMLVIGVPFAIWLLVSRKLPNQAAGWLELVPGAVVVAVGVQAMQLFIAYFLGPKLNSATQLYGLLGVATTLLFCFYLVGRLIVASATLNAEVAEARSERTSSASSQRVDGTGNARRRRA